MDSWNGTCGITNTPITVGTKVEAILILNNFNLPKASGTCYITGYARPLSFTFEGIYDEYGSIKHIPDNQPAVHLIMEFFEREVKDNNFICTNEDYIFDKNNFIELLKNIEREDVFLTTNLPMLSKEDRNVGILMFNSESLNNLRNTLLTTDLEIFDILTVDSLSQDMDFAIEDLFTNPTPDKIWQKFLTEAEDSLKGNNVYSDEFIKQQEKSIIKYKKMLYSTTSAFANYDIRATTRNCNLIRVLSSNEQSDTINFFKIFEIIKNDIENINISKLKKMLSNMITLINIMSQLNKPWLSQCGKGGQEINEPLYMSLSKEINRIAVSDIDNLTGTHIGCIENFNEFTEGRYYTCSYFNKDTGEYTLIIEYDDKKDKFVIISYYEYMKYFEY